MYLSLQTAWKAEDIPKQKVSKDVTEFVFTAPSDTPIFDLTLELSVEADPPIKEVRSISLQSPRESIAYLFCTELSKIS